MSMVSFGAKLSVNDSGASGNPQVEWDEVQMITSPGYEATTPENTHLQTTDRERTFLPGMLDAGVISWEMLYTENNWDRCSDIINEVYTYVITDPQSSSPVTATCSAILRKFSVDFETRGDTTVPVIKCEAKVTGGWTFA